MLALPILIRSIGQGLVIVPIALSATAGVRREDQGIAAGLFNMSQQLGGAIGLAAIATVAAAATRAGGGGIAGGTHGIHVAFLVTLCLPLLAAVVTVLALRNPTPESAIEASAREVFHPSRTDPVPTLRRPEGELAPSDSHRALEDPPSPQRGGVTDGADLTASAAKECRE
jgi:MFS family permease